MRKYVLIISSLFLFSCEEEDIQQNTSMGLIINEFLASNDSCCPDSFGAMTIGLNYTTIQTIR